MTSLILLVRSAKCFAEAGFLTLCKVSAAPIESNGRLFRCGSNWSSIAILAPEPMRTGPAGRVVTIQNSKFNDSVQSVNWKDCVRLDSHAVEVVFDEWQKLRWSAGKAV
jgi:hypothetical protein